MENINMNLENIIISVLDIKSCSLIYFPTLGSRPCGLGSVCIIFLIDWPAIMPMDCITSQGWKMTKMEDDGLIDCPTQRS